MADKHIGQITAAASADTDLLLFADVSDTTAHASGTPKTQTKIDFLSGKADTDHDHALDDLTDVTITSAETGQVLKWNGTAWTNQADSTASEGGASATNLATTLSSTSVIITSDTGTDATIPATDSTNAGVMTPAQKAKLDGVATGATANDTDANLKNRSNHTGAQAISTVTGLQTALDGKVDENTAITGATKTKLTYDAKGLVTAGTDAAIADITGLQTALDGKAATSHGHTAADVSDFNTAADARITAQKGAASGIAPLNGSSKIDATYLPSYVDDVETYANLASFPATGETGKIYIAEDTNKTHRWTGSAYTEISSSAGAAWGTVTGTLADQTDLQSALDAKATTTALTTHTSDTANPHSVTKAQVGLANVDNTSDANKPISTATQAALDAKQAAGTTLTSLEGLTLAAGDILYATGADTLAKLPAGTDGEVLTLASGLPDWAAASGGGGGGSGVSLGLAIALNTNIYRMY